MFINQKLFDYWFMWGKERVCCFQNIESGDASSSVV